MTQTQLGLDAIDRRDGRTAFIARIPNALSSSRREYLNDVYVVDRLLVITDHLSSGTGEVRRRGQFEMPISAVGWILETIESGLERKPSEGGLAGDRFHVDESIEGEKIEVRYGVSACGEGLPGYTLYNFSRSSYILPRYSQEFTFSVALWRDQVRGLFKDLVDRCRAGEFAATAAARSPSIRVP